MQKKISLHRRSLLRIEDGKDAAGKTSVELISGASKAVHVTSMPQSGLAETVITVVIMAGKLHQFWTSCRQLALRNPARLKTFSIRTERSQAS